MSNVGENAYVTINVILDVHTILGIKTHAWMQLLEPAELSIKNYEDIERTGWSWKNKIRKGKDFCWERSN